MDLSKFSAKDAKIVKDNEGKSPYELLELGLSQKGYDYLLSFEGASNEPKKENRSEAPKEAKETKPKEVSNAVKPTVRPVEEKAKVTHTTPKEYKAQKVAANSDIVKVYNKRTGKTVKMKASFAQRLLKNPNQYSLV